MDLSLEIAGDQIEGARDYQEDAFLITYLDDEGGESRSSALVVVADGMGGHAAGNIASNLVVSTFNKTFTGKFGKQDAPTVLREALTNANDGLKESIKETPGLDGMGCTMVTAAFTKGKVFWISVGDSHLYLIRDRDLSKKNEDHSYGGYLDRMRQQGIDVEAEAGLSRNMLMSAMTGEEIAEIDCPAQGYQLLPGDRVIIASDGIDTLDEETILKTSTWSHSPKECVSGLLRAVDESKRPRQDNTTIVVVDAAERPTAEAPAPGAGAAAVPQVQVGDVRQDIARERDFRVAEKRSGGGMGMVIGLILLLALGGGGGYAYMSGKWQDWIPSDLGSSKVTTTRTPEQPKQQPEQPEQPKQVEQPKQPEQPEQPEQPKQPVQVASVEPSTPATTPTPAPKEFRDKLRSGGQGPIMVMIPPGSFEMGSPDHSINVDERPSRVVNVPAFAMSKHEVTYAEYERFAKATGRKLPKNPGLDKSRHPVIFVSWDDAFGYTKWLSKQTGKNYQLPSEAQWEYAAAAGTDSPFWWGFEVGSNRAHCFDCDTGLNPRLPTSVGRFGANPFGLHDTSGNVGEWVHDCFHPNYEGAPTDGTVWEGGDCSYRIARGGSYLNTSKSIRPRKRAKWKSQRGYDSIGFRIVRIL